LLTKIISAKPFKALKLTRTFRGCTYRLFQVIGTINGARIRKTFAQKTEAETERQRQEILRKNSSHNLRIVTRLTDEQVRDAEAASKLIGIRKTSLSECVRYYLDNHRGAENAPTLANAVTEYVAARERNP